MHRTPMLRITSPAATCTVNLTKAQRAAIAQHVILSDDLRDRLSIGESRTKDIEFEPDELEKLIGQMETVESRMKGSQKQMLGRILGRLHTGLDVGEVLSIRTTTIFRIKITLLGTQPPIWRRIQIEDCDLAQLHGFIQLAMGWEFCHLWSLQIGEEEYGDRSMLGEQDCNDAHRTKLSQIVSRSGEKLFYLYDFGDSWEHEILIEKTLAADPKQKYPRCIDGKRACPPEDCGGVWGYENLLDAVKDPSHKDHEEMLEWIGEGFDPEFFDIDAANQLLRMKRTCSESS